MTLRRTWSRHVIVESLFDELLRGVPGPETGDGRLAPKLLELLLQLGGDQFLGDFDGHLLGRRAGILDLDLIRALFLFLDGGRRCLRGGLFFGHVQTSTHPLEIKQTRGNGPRR